MYGHTYSAYGKLPPIANFSLALFTNYGYNVIYGNTLIYICI